MIRFIHCADIHLGSPFTGLQQKQMNGEELTEEDMDYANDLYQKASSNEAIQTLMQAEQRLNVMMQDINRILTTSLQELYQ